VAMLGLALAACMAPSPSPTILASAPPAGPTTTPAPSASVLIECLDATNPPPPRSPPPGYVGGNFCTIALPVVLAALAGQPGVPIMVVFDAGIYCPTPGLLFPGTSCPGGGIPPSPGGQSLGHALVSFAGTSVQAYLNLWGYPISGATVTAQLIAVASAPPSSTPSSPSSSRRTPPRTTPTGRRPIASAGSPDRPRSRRGSGRYPPPSTRCSGRLGSRGRARGHPALAIAGRARIVGLP